MYFSLIIYLIVMVNKLVVNVSSKRRLRQITERYRGRITSLMINFSVRNKDVVSIRVALVSSFSTCLFESNCFFVLIKFSVFLIHSRIYSCNFVFHVTLFTISNLQQYLNQHFCGLIGFCMCD